MTKKKNTVVLFPFLFALFPPIFLFSHNIKEVPLNHVILPLLIPLALMVILWMLLAKTPLTKYKRGFFTLILMILFYSFGDLYDFISMILSGYEFDSFKQYQLLIPVLGILGWIFHLIKKSPKNFRSITKILNISISFLLVFNLINITFFGIKSYITARRFKQTSQALIKNVDFNKTLPRPDIYYIVLDEYASSETMKKIFNYDNSSFEDSLRERGFLISKESRTRFSRTLQCLATVFNMEYWTKEKNQFQLMRYNTVASYIKKFGYRIINLPAHFRLRFALSDKVYYYKLEMHSIICKDFYMMIMKKSILRFLHDSLIESSNFTHIFRNSVLYDLEKLAQIPISKEPQFIYAHINCPHEPYVFNSNGGFIERRNYYNLRDKIYYIGQYQYINKRILNVIDTIMSRSGKKPVIILQSDHGIRGNTGGPVQLDVGKEWQRIFNAMYLPNIHIDSLDESFAPVNTFRFIFNHYFNQSFPLLPK